MKAKIEQWEIDLRAKLEKELPEGAYQIGVAPTIAITGKQGKINFEVMFQKEMRKYGTTKNV